MKIFRAASLALDLRELQEHYQACQENKRKAANSNALSVALAGGPKTAPDADELFVITNLLRNLVDLCNEVKLVDAKQKINLTLSHLDLNPNEVDSSLGADLRNVFDVFMSDLWARVFVQVPARFIDFIDCDLLFGEAVATKFKSALPDIREAGNCMAVGSNTAAVFHLMRVAEYGLRALAHDRRIKLDKNKPIDLSTWEEVIKGLEKAEQAIQGYPKTHAREAQLDFYHGAMMEVRGFKGKFRNRVMHSRESYDPHEAMSAFTHVQKFMQVLSSRIAEGVRTPMIWKGRKWLS